jgi:predicted nucleic acid-binding protein
LSTITKTVFALAEAGEVQILIPAIVLVEIVYLAEKGRIAHDAVQNVISLFRTHADNYLIVPLDLGVATALQQIDRTTVPDMPDRIIAATAYRLNLPLLTRDPQIQRLRMIDTVW